MCAISLSFTCPRTQAAFSEFALFFHDKYGGTFIAVAWKPHAFIPQPFKASKLQEYDYWYARQCPTAYLTPAINTHCVLAIWLQLSFNNPVSSFCAGVPCTLQNPSRGQQEGSKGKGNYPTSSPMDGCGVNVRIPDILVTMDIHTKSYK